MKRALISTVATGLIAATLTLSAPAADAAVRPNPVSILRTKVLAKIATQQTALDEVLTDGRYDTLPKPVRVPGEVGVVDWQYRAAFDEGVADDSEALSWLESNAKAASSVKVLNQISKAVGKFHVAKVYDAAYDAVDTARALEATWETIEFRMEDLAYLVPMEGDPGYNPDLDAWLDTESDTFQTQITRDAIDYFLVSWYDTNVNARWKSGTLAKAVERAQAIADEEDAFLAEINDPPYEIPPPPAA